MSITGTLGKIAYQPKPETLIESQEIAALQRTNGDLNRLLLEAREQLNESDLPYKAELTGIAVYVGLKLREPVTNLETVKAALMRLCRQYEETIEKIAGGAMTLTADNERNWQTIVADVYARGGYMIACEIVEGQKAWRHLSRDEALADTVYDILVNGVITVEPDEAEQG